MVPFRLIRPYLGPFLILVLLLQGCQHPSMVPVIGTGRGPPYVVQEGDTLYAIAFRNGIDYRDLARRNNIPPPFVIFPGQTLKLVGQSVPERDSGPVAVTHSDNVAERKVTGEPGQQPAPVPAASGLEWQWPHPGQVVKSFSLKGALNKGIDIAGKQGERVRSAASGVVVYAGGGLRGYGKLVIVKHNDLFLSAYGHNESILVKEGDSVKAGQVLARVGRDGDNDVLHFEIRRNGIPEDPLRYLPMREASEDS
ncbi:MAG: hypothetical protein CNE99_02075 [OM182 bacterium MED-G24]|uniref:LysM domain-containing protein n=1 Tax=OM182 bacterium MED-G24 TaxID=1986255 RepID=A0A2A5WXQ2_9GAMM|nr:MAG: hypothetical protein CNE99_02075 [OM182 bacterium MED-G24]